MKHKINREVRVKSLLLGNSNAFLVSIGNEIFLVDGGLGDRSDAIIAEAKGMVAHFNGIKFVFVTHAHYDHVGSVAAIREKTGAQIIAHELEAANLAAGLSPVPSGTMWLSRQISWLGCFLFRHCIKFKGFSVDVLFSDRLELDFAGEKIFCYHLPGHTKGSIGIKIGSHFFAGDSLFHLLPGRIYPPFANDEKRLGQSWKAILNTESKFIWPGHGKIIFRRLLENCLKKNYPQIYR